MPRPVFDADAYLERIGMGRPPAPTEDGLHELHVAHATSIPFENLDIHLGLQITLDAPALFDKLVRRRRGGYCFEQSCLFLRALETFGFHARPLAARVRLGIPGTRARTHMLLLVDFGARRFLADVGFGGHNLLVPVPFELGREHRDAGAISRIERDDESFVLRVEEHGELKDYYSFGLERQHPVDFEMANWFCSTAPSSKFVTTKIVSSVSTAQRATLVDRRLRIVRGAEVEERRLDADDAFLGVLREVFGIELPEGRALRWPASA